MAPHASSVVKRSRTAPCDVWVAPPVGDEQLGELRFLISQFAAAYKRPLKPREPQEFAAKIKALKHRDMDASSQQSSRLRCYLIFSADSSPGAVGYMAFSEPATLKIPPVLKQLFILEESRGRGLATAALQKLPFGHLGELLAVEQPVKVTHFALEAAGWRLVKQTAEEWLYSRGAIAQSQPAVDLAQQWEWVESESVAGQDSWAHVLPVPLAFYPAIVSKSSLHSAVDDISSIISLLGGGIQSSPLYKLYGSDGAAHKESQDAAKPVGYAHVETIDQYRVGTQRAIDISSKANPLDTSCVTARQMQPRTGEEPSSECVREERNQHCSASSHIAEEDNVPRQDGNRCNSPARSSLLLHVDADLVLSSREARDSLQEDDTAIPEPQDAEASPGVREARDSFHEDKTALSDTQNDQESPSLARISKVGKNISARPHALCVDMAVAASCAMSVAAAEGTHIVVEEPAVHAKEPVEAPSHARFSEQEELELSTASHGDDDCFLHSDRIFSAMERTPPPKSRNQCAGKDSFTPQKRAKLRHMDSGRQMIENIPPSTMQKPQLANKMICKISEHAKAGADDTAMHLESPSEEGSLFSKSSQFTYLELRVVGTEFINVKLARQSKGLKVLDLRLPSPSGLQAGDVITKVDGVSVRARATREYPMLSDGVALAVARRF